MVTLVKRHNLACSALHASTLVIVADKPFKPVNKKEEGIYENYEPSIAQLSTLCQ